MKGRISTGLRKQSIFQLQPGIHWKEIFAVSNWFYNKNVCTVCQQFYLKHTMKNTSVLLFLLTTTVLHSFFKFLCSNILRWYLQIFYVEMCFPLLSQSILIVYVRKPTCISNMSNTSKPGKCFTQVSYIFNFSCWQKNCQGSNESSVSKGACSHSYQQKLTMYFS